MHKIDPLYTTEAFTDEFVEYFDEDNHPLLVSSQAMLSSNGLWRRKVGVIFYDMRRRVYVCRRKQADDVSLHFWDLSVSGNVRVAESTEDAALRHAHVQLGVMDISVNPVVAMRDTLNLWFVSLYCIGPTHAVPHDFSQLPNGTGQFMDKHELSALHAYAPELCTPLLVWCLLSRVLWRT